MATKWWMHRKSIWRRAAEWALFGQAGGVRRLINASPWVVAGGAAVAVIFSAVVIAETVREARPPTPKSYYFDLQSETLFVDQADRVPPIRTPIEDGKLEGGMPAGARAYVFSCGSCGPAAQRFVGYVLIEHRSAHKGQQKLAEAGEDSAVVLNEEQLAAWKRGPLARRPRGPRTGWTPVHSERMREILSELRRRCDGRLPRRCRPDPRTPAGRVME